MSTLLQGIADAVTSVVAMFVNFFKGLSDVFVYTPTGGTEQLSVVGGVLIIGLVIMFGFMILRWLVSLFRGI